MKLKDVLKNIQEEWLTTNRKKDIFECPLKPKEINSVAREIGDLKAVRFIADNRDKKLYVFPPDFFHGKAWRLITKEKGKDASLEQASELLWGVAIFVHGIWVVDSSDTTNYTEENIKKFKWINTKGIKIKKWDRKSKFHPLNFLEKKDKA